jgi:signal transduction histidine kinase/CheY-like chemotaxis protein
MKRALIILALGIVFLTVLIWHLDEINNNHWPIAEKGRMDLTYWDFQKEGSIILNGEWECYDGQLLTPEAFAGNSSLTPSLTGYSNITANRLHHTSDLEIGTKGVRTFRLILKTGQKEQQYGVKINNIPMSNRLFINGKMMGHSGNPAEKEEGYQPGTNAYEVFFSDDEGQVEIILQVANYDDPYRVLFYHITFGNQEDIRLQTIFTLAIEACGSALCFIIALYYLAIYFIRQKEKEMLYSFLEFFFLSIIFLFSGEKLIYLLVPKFPFEIFYKIQTISLIGIAYSITAFSKIANSKIISDLMYKIFQGIFQLILFGVLLMPVYRHIYLKYFSDFFILFVYLYLIYRLVYIYIEYKLQPMDRKILFLYIVCLSCIFIPRYNTILMTVGVSSKKTVGSIAITLFIILSQVFLAIRFAINSEKLIRMDKMKEEFFIKSSYALNAPLNSILNLSKSISEGVTDQINYKEDVRNKAELTKTIAEKLIDNVKSTLDVAMLHNNQLKLSETVVDMKICTELVAISLEDYKNSNINIVIDMADSLLVMADEGRVRQVILNLLMNALKNMTQGTIKIKGTTQGNLVYISVEDNGYGIPEEMLEEIFEPYITLRNQGIGLGLYITRQLVEHMGGFIYVEWSKIDEGSRFVFSLPLYKGDEQKAVNITLPEKQFVNDTSFHNLKVWNTNQLNNILIVDDEIFNIQTASNILEREGYNVIAAASGQEAIQVMETVKLDLVILDIMMPGSSGIKTCKKIREKYSIIELPVLLSSSVSINNDLDLGLQAEANDFISKPFMEKELLARVRTLIALKISIEDASKSELAFLQAQIKPHFIYNAINTMVSYCYTDSEKVADLLINFSKYLRFTFDIDNERMSIPLRSEIEMIDAYMKIQNARFGNEYTIEYDIDKALEDKEIPSLIIQPLVENSIKHGLRQKDGAGIVKVAVMQENEYFTIRVKDSGIGMSPEKVKRLNDLEYKSEGVGLWNIKKRIIKMKNASIDISSMEGEGTTVTISIQT